MKPDKRFDKLLIPVHTLVKEGKSIINSSPELHEREEFRNFTSEFSNQVVSYIVYLYDEHSPLIRDYRDLAERKDAALSLSGFSRQKNGKWSRPVQEFKDLKNEAILKMILGYLELQHNMKMDMIHVFEQMFLEYREHMLRPVPVPNTKDAMSQKNMLAAVDQKKKLREECMAIKKDLDQLYDEVYGDNEDLMSNEVQMHVRKSTPETIALHKTA